jgi:hypothetical protein
MLLKNVVIPTDLDGQKGCLWNVNCVDGLVQSVLPSSDDTGSSSANPEDTFDAAGGILLPSCV